MAYIGTPIVRNGQLWVAQQLTTIQVDSPHWFGWLHTTTSFSYALGAPTFYSLTLRKEKRRQHSYWYAYLKSGNKLHNAYAGRTEALSTARLDQVAHHLLQKVRQHDVLTDEKKKEGD